MKTRRTLILTVALALVAGHVRAEQWVCPLAHVMYLGNGWSEFYCEECDGQYGLYALPTNSGFGDCGDSQKTNCFTVPSDERPAFASSKLIAGGFTQYFTGAPTLKGKKARILSETVIQAGNRKFRLYLIQVNPMCIAGVGYEIAPDTTGLAQTVNPRWLKPTSRHTFTLQLASVRYRLIGKASK